MGNMTLRAKVMVVVIPTLIVVLGIAGSAFLWTARSSVSAENQNAARVSAECIAASVVTFGVTGDMEGLDLFLEYVQKQEGIEDVHVNRAPKVVEQYEARKSAKALGKVEQQVMWDRKEVTIIDSENHRIRFVMPIRWRRHRITFLRPAYLGFTAECRTRRCGYQGSGRPSWGTQTHDVGVGRHDYRWRGGC
jgi:hypothetical protein